MNAECNLFADWVPCQILRNKSVCETTGPIDNELSKMHEAEVHVFSDSVLCPGKSATASSEIKFTERWKEHLEYYKETAKRIDGKHIQFKFHIVPGTKTNESIQNRWMDSTRSRRRWTTLHCRNLPSSSKIHGDDERNFHVLHQDRKEVTRNFCKMQGENAACLGKFKPGILHVFWSRFTRDMEFWKIHRQPKRKMGRISKSSHGCFSCTKQSRPEKEARAHQKGELQREDRNMHFNAGACIAEDDKRSSLVQPVTSVCFAEFVIILNRYNSTILKVPKIRLRLLSLQEIRNTASLSRASVADDLSDYASLPEGHLSTRTSTVESDLSATSAQAVEGNLWQITHEASTEAVVEKANVARDKELVRLCNVADYAETLKIGQCLQARPNRNSFGKFCNPCGDVDRPTNSKCGCILQAKMSQSKNWV